MTFFIVRNNHPWKLDRAEAFSAPNIEAALTEFRVRLLTEAVPWRLSLHEGLSEGTWKAEPVPMDTETAELVRELDGSEAKAEFEARIAEEYP